MMNPAILFEIQNKWNRFTENHPKFPAFLRAVSATTLNPGSIVELSITTAEGQNIATNVKLSEEDLELLKELAELSKNAR